MEAGGNRGTLKEAGAEAGDVCAFFKTFIELMRLEANPIWPWPMVVAVAVALIIFSHWTYVPGTPRRRLLLGLRWAAIALALFAALRPRLGLYQRTETVGHVDRSAGPVAEHEPARHVGQSVAVGSRSPIAGRSAS